MKGTSPGEVSVPKRKRISKPVLTKKGTDTTVKKSPGSQEYVERKTGGVPTAVLKKKNGDASKNPRGKMSVERKATTGYRKIVFFLIVP